MHKRKAAPLPNPHVKSGGDVDPGAYGPGRGAPAVWAGGDGGLRVRTPPPPTASAGPSLVRRGTGASANLSGEKCWKILRKNKGKLATYLPLLLLRNNEHAGVRFLDVAAVPVNVATVAGVSGNP